MASRSAAPVVGDPDVDPAAGDALVARGDAEADAAGIGVLRRVREQLGGDEVRVALDRRGQRGIREVDLDDDRHGAARGERLEAGREAAVLQDRRREPARERPQLVERLAGLVARLADECLRRLGVVLEPALDGREVHLQAHEPLLRAVVDVPLEAAERRVLGLHGGAARGGELRRPRPRAPRSARRRARPGR